MTHTSTDQLQRFSFDDTAIRGEIAHLNSAYQDVLTRHQYPTEVSHPLGQLMAATALMSGSLKFKGRLTLQVRLSGPVTLLQAETNESGQLRAIARYDTEQPSSQLILENGQLVITLEPEHGQRYQGIVSIDGGQIADALENYFEQSEQLKTRFWLACDASAATGFMLQKMPETTGNPINSDDWDRLSHLASTLKDDELLTLDTNTLLYRLYHEELVRLHPSTPLHFFCTCSKPRLSAALAQLGQAELETMLVENPHIDITCEFCQQEYRFDQDDITALFQESRVH